MQKTIKIKANANLLPFLMFREINQYIKCKKQLIESIKTDN